MENIAQTPQWRQEVGEMPTKKEPIDGRLTQIENNITQIFDGLRDLQQQIAEIADVLRERPPF